MQPPTGRNMMRTALLTLVVLTASSTSQANEPRSALGAMDAMLTRVSIRKFDQNRKVSDGELRKIMDAGYRTQTMDGSSPFEFIQIRNRSTLKAIGSSGKFASWMGQAPAAIAVVVRNQESPNFYRENGSLAIMNMTYKAQQLGLGTCFLGTRNNNKMKAVLGLGKGQHLVTVIPVGAPSGGKFPASPKRYPVEWTVSQAKYGTALTMLEGVEPSKKGGTSIGSHLGGNHVKVESFNSRPVEKTKLATALQAMQHAPSSKNKQHWRWVLVTDRKEKAQVARAARDRTLAQAPVIAVLAGSQDSRPFMNPKGWGRKRMSPNFINHGAAMALRNFQIGLESQGLGVRITGLSRRSDSRMRTLLSPTKALSGKRVHFMAAVGLGYARRTSTRKVGGIPANRIFKERYSVRGPRRGK